MTSMPYYYSWSWQVIAAPLNDAELERYQASRIGLLGDYFNIKVNVRHQVCAIKQQPQQFFLLSTPLDLGSFESSLVLPSQEFLDNGPSIMQTRFRLAAVPHQLILDMMPRAMTYAKAMTLPPNCLSGNVPNFRVFRLDFDIVIRNLYEDDDDDEDDDLDDDGNDDIINMIMRESMEEVNMVPASKSAIESLGRVKLGIVDHTVERCCCICMTEFDDGDVEVSSMPCKHVYHEECIVKWLETSHMCPLCRYPMPTH